MYYRSMRKRFLHKSFYLSQQPFYLSQQLFYLSQQLFYLSQHFFNHRDNFSLLQLIYYMHCYYQFKMKLVDFIPNSSFSLFNNKTQYFWKIFHTWNHQYCLLFLQTYFNLSVWQSIVRSFLKILLLFKCFRSTGLNQNHLYCLLFLQTYVNLSVWHSIVRLF